MKLGCNAFVALMRFWTGGKVFCFEAARPQMIEDLRLRCAEVSAIGMTGPPFLQVIRTGACIAGFIIGLRLPAFADAISM